MVIYYEFSDKVTKKTTTHADVYDFATEMFPEGYAKVSFDEYFLIMPEENDDLFFADTKTLPDNEILKEYLENSDYRGIIYLVSVENDYSEDLVDCPTCEILKNYVLKRSGWGMIFKKQHEE